MLFDDTYRTISTPSEGLFKDKGSKFIAYAVPIKAETDVKDIVARIKAEHPKARHHCWAMRFSTDRSVFRINDDGEPSGTAGRPILNTLLSHNITNVLIVVVRYFGGTLLGVPGLINAYKSAAEDALQCAEVIECTVNDYYEMNFDYLCMNDVMKVIKAESLGITSQQFDTDCCIRFWVRHSQAEKVAGLFTSIEKLKLKYLFSA